MNENEINTGEMWRLMVYAMADGKLDRKDFKICVAICAGHHAIKDIARKVGLYPQSIRTRIKRIRAVLTH